jgi:ribose transport system substrate-binding protein
VKSPLKRGGIFAAGLAALALVAAGCSGTAAADPSSTSTGTGAAAGLAKAQATVKKLEATTANYPVPTASVPGVKALAGRTVYFIPLIQQIPTFVVAAQALNSALSKAGLKLQVCDGQAQPDAIAACAKQAQAADAAGIITDAIPYGMAQQAFDSAKAAGVPIIIADQYPPAGQKNDNSLSYLPGVVDQPSQLAWWLIADSQGKGNAILAGEKDSPSSWQYLQNSLPIYTDNCPGCTIQVKEITASTNDLLASATSANLLANPDATYYTTEFEDSLQPTIQGIQQSGRTGISLGVGGGTVNGLGLLKSGSSPVKAVVAVDEAYEGWALADMVLRMATKSGPVDETIPSRLFTSSNIGSISITSTDQASGAWFGDTSFQDEFAKLWGVG